MFKKIKVEKTFSHCKKIHKYTTTTTTATTTIQDQCNLVIITRTTKHSDRLFLPVSKIK